MRHVVTLLCLLALAACAPPPKPFQHDPSEIPLYRPVQEKTELAIAPPKNMPPGMGRRVATALAIELQSYGIVAAVQPAEAPIQLNSVMSTRDADLAIEIQIDWRVEGAPRNAEPAVSKTRTRPEDYAEQSERLISRIAQQAAPRVATLIGRPPNFQPRSPGQIAAGVSLPMEPPADATLAAAPAAATGATPAATAPQAKAATEPQLKVLVAPITGAPSDGNRQLYSGMRRALGSSKIVIVDGGGDDVFTVAGSVSLTPIDDRMGRLTVKWVLKDPSGKSVGDIEQTNPVPLEAARGSWAGFGDIVASAASEGVLELLEKALGRPH